MCFSTSRTHAHSSRRVSRWCLASCGKIRHLTSRTMSIGFRSLALSRWTRNSSGKRLRYDLSWDEDESRQVEAEPQLDRQLREGEALGRGAVANSSRSSGELGPRQPLAGRLLRQEGAAAAERPPQLRASRARRRLFRARRAARGSCHRRRGRRRATRSAETSRGRGRGSCGSRGGRTCGGHFRRCGPRCTRPCTHSARGGRRARLDPCDQSVRRAGAFGGRLHEGLIPLRRAA